MNDKTIDIIANALDGVTRWEWNAIKRSIDQEYKIQSLKMPFRKTENFEERTKLLIEINKME
ncbi:MAG: hypothetical protein RSF40_01930 [Oscillospiraceae bacterium]